MSKSSDKIDNLSDYIYIETVSINFILKTKGDFITHDLDPIPFHPNMSDVERFTNSKQILFPSFIKISQSDVNKNSKIGASRIELFTHLDLYSKFIKNMSKERVTPLTSTGLLVIDKDKNRDNDNGENFKRIMVSSEYISKAEIILNNIGVMKHIFFPINGNLFMLGHKFLITESRYISHEASEEMYDYSNKKFKLPKSFTVTIELNILDATNNENIGKFSERSCIAKKTSIRKDFDEMFGTNAKSNIMMPINTLKTVMTVNRNFGKAITDWESRNIYKQPPKTEREKLEFESKMDPLARNKRDYDEKMVGINSLPPGYVKELNKFDEDIKLFIARSNEIIENDDKAVYNKKLLKILFNDIIKSGYTVEREGDKPETNENEVNDTMETKENDFVKKDVTSRHKFIEGIKPKNEKTIYERYKPETRDDKYFEEINDKITSLEKEFADSDDNAEQNELKTKIEKLKELTQTNKDTNKNDTQERWQQIVRSVDTIKKAVKDIESKDKVKEIKDDNENSIKSIDKKINDVYNKLKILNARNRSIFDEDAAYNVIEESTISSDKANAEAAAAVKKKMEKSLTDLIGKDNWPYFIPYIYSHETTYDESEDPNDTKDELITELNGYYADYIKLQKILNPKKMLNGSISILKLQLKTLKDMIANTDKISNKLSGDRNNIRDVTNNPVFKEFTTKIEIVKSILNHQENIRKALEFVISQLSELNTSNIRKTDDEYIPSNDDGKIILNIVKNLNKKFNDETISTPLSKLLLSITPLKKGGSKISRKQKFMSRKKRNNKKNNKKYNITKKKNNNITKKKYIKRI